MTVHRLLQCVLALTILFAPPFLSATVAAVTDAAIGSPSGDISPELHDTILFVPPLS